MARQKLVKRRQLHCPVVNQLDHRAARAKGNHRTKRIVGNQADVDFAPFAGARHGLHGQAVQARIGSEALDGLHHLGIGVAHASSVLNVERYTPNVRFVADVGRINLQCNRKTKLRGDHHRLVGAARQNGLGDRNVESRQQRLGLHFGQYPATLGQHVFNDQPRSLNVGPGQRGQRRRRLLQQLLVLVKGSNVAKRAHRCLRRAKAGNGRVAENATPCEHRGVAHPAGQKRLAQGAFDGSQRVCHFGPIDARLGRVNGQHAVDLPVTAGRINGSPVVRRGGVFRQVDQVGQRGVIGQLDFERAERFG